MIAALWSAEVLHAIRLRTESFRSLCPDGADRFAAWWSGREIGGGLPSVLVTLDPLTAGRQRAWVGLDEALNVRPRHRGYAEAARKLGR